LRLQYPGMLPGSADQCILGSVYLRRSLSRKCQVEDDTWQIQLKAYGQVESRGRRVMSYVLTSWYVCNLSGVLVGCYICCYHSILFVVESIESWADSLCIVGWDWHWSNDLVEHNKVYGLLFATKLHGWQGMLMNLSVLHYCQSRTCSVTVLLFEHCTFCLQFGYSAKRISDYRNVATQLRLLLPVALLPQYKLVTIVIALLCRSRLLYICIYSCSIMLSVAQHLANGFTQRHW